MHDPMELTAEHCERWRQRFDTIGSSRAASGYRKTFELNAAGTYLVKEHNPATTLIIYDGGNEAEALRAYNDC